MKAKVRNPYPNPSFELPMRLSCVRLSFVVLFIFAACSPEPPPKHLSRAFYYWKSDLKLKTSEQKALTDLGASALYVKFFDISWDRQRNEALPVAMLRFDSATLPKQNIVPVVFLTDESLAKMDARAIVELANHAAGAIQSIAHAMQSPLKEVQFDCDWTAKTESKYFHFIDAARAGLPKGITISATIRLHQVKYRERTGVPPIDRGMLMYYNMANWRDANTKNSIFDRDEAEHYIDYVHDYPLPLDLALPIFRWTLVYRNNHFLTILNSVSSQDLDRLTFLNHDVRNRYLVKRDTFAFGASLRTGDLLRAEECKADQLEEGGRDVLRRIRNEDLRIALYHLDSVTLSHYSHGTLDSVFSGKS